MQINEENYFEYAEAIHAYCILNHGGQTCPLYQILSMSDFSPGIFWSESKVALDNPVYSEINSSNVESLFNQLTWFLLNNK